MIEWKSRTNWKNEVGVPKYLIEQALKEKTFVRVYCSSKKYEGKYMDIYPELVTNTLESGPFHDKADLNNGKDYYIWNYKFLPNN